MIVKILGSGGYHPTETRHTTCVMIPEYGIVLDAGTAFFRVGENLATDHLVVLLSHAHLDHVSGLTYVFDIFKNKLQQNSITVYGRADHLQAVENTLFSQPLFSAKPSMLFTPVVAQKELALKNGVRVLAKENNHPGGSLGYRLTFPNGKIVVYLTDTIASEADVDFARDADLLLHECYAKEKERDFALATGHSWPSSVYDLAAKAGVKQLALIHLNPSHNLPDPFGEKDLSVTKKRIIANDNLTLSV